MCYRIGVEGFHGHGGLDEYSELRNFTITTTNKLRKAKPMGTSYGRVIIEFPGFPPILFQTVDERVSVPSGWGRWRSISMRNVRRADGTTLRLSKKERSRLSTFVKKCNKKTRFEGAPHYRRVRPYKTLDEVRNW